MQQGNKDPFAEFGGEKVASGKDPFAEFGGTAVEKQVAPQPAMSLTEATLTPESELPAVSINAAEPEKISPVVTVPRLYKDEFQRRVAALPSAITGNKTAREAFVAEINKRRGLPKQVIRDMFDEAVTTQAVIQDLQLKRQQEPDNYEILNQLGQLHNSIGQYDLAYEAYDALEGVLQRTAMAEQQEERKRGIDLGPQYVLQRQAPAVAGMAYSEYLRGNIDNAKRLEQIARSAGYSGPAMPQVGDGDYTAQPEALTGGRYGFAGTDPMIAGRPRTAEDDSPEFQYLNDVADAIGNLQGIQGAVGMSLQGMERMRKADVGYKGPAPATLNEIGENISLLTGLSEYVLGALAITEPVGAITGLPFMMAPSYAPQEVSEWMMPVSKLLRDQWLKDNPDKSPEEIPKWIDAPAVLGDFAVMALTAGLIGGGAKKARKAVATRSLGKELLSAVEAATPEQMQQAYKAVEARIEQAGGDINVFEQQGRERFASFKRAADDLKAKADKAKEIVEAEQVVAELPPYNPEPAPQSLRTVAEGADVELNGRPGKLDRGDDGTWYFIDDQTGKSEQIPVEDKFNPTETLTELGISVLPEPEPAQVARAMADAEQVGEVEYKGKKYFVSIDRVGNEDPVGDVVFERTSDGRLVNRFDSHPDPEFAGQRKLAIVNAFLESKGLPKRESLIEPWKKSAKPEAVKEGVQPKPIADEVIEERGQEGREEVLLSPEGRAAEGAVTPEVATPEPKVEIVATPEPKVAVDPLADVGVEAVKIAAPIRELGTGSKVYFENDYYRVNDNQKGAVLLNVNAKGDANGTPIANLEFATPEEALYVAESLNKIYPDGVPQALLIEKVAADLSKQYNNKINASPVESPMGVPRPETPTAPAEVAKEVPRELQKPAEKGGEVVVRFADNVNVKGSYKIIEADDLKPSHLTSGERNPEHSISKAQPKERTDVASKAQQDKIASDPNFDLVSADTDAYGGAPVVNTRGEVIQGNNRSIGLKKHYSIGGEKYKADLAQRAAEFGYTPEEVMTMKNPILVREVAVNDQMAVRLGQYKATDIETGGKSRPDPITVVNKLRPNEKSALAKLFYEGDYETLKDAIRANQKEILDILKNHLRPSELRSMLKVGEDVLGQTGMDDVASIATQFIFEGGDAVLPEVFDHLPNTVRKNLEKAVPEILQSPEGKSLLPSVQNAMMAIAKFNDSGISKFENWLDQVDMFLGVSPKEVFTPFELELSRKLVEARTQGEAKQLFKSYNEMVADKAADLFAGPEKGAETAQAVKEIFNVELNEKDLSAKPERSLKKADGEPKGKAAPEAKPAKPIVEVGTPPTVKAKIMSALDDLEKQILEMPGIKDIAPDADKAGAGIKMEDVVKVLFQAVRKSVDAGFSAAEAVNRAFAELRKNPEIAQFFEAVDEGKFREHVDKIFRGAIEKTGVKYDERDMIFAAQNRTAQQVREALGLPSDVAITDQHKRDFDTVLSRAQAMKDKGFDIDKFAQDVVLQGKTISPEEQAALVFRNIELYNQSKQLEQAIAKADADGDIVEQDRLRQEIELNEQRQINVLDAMQIAGSEWGLAGRMRQLLMQRDYSVAGVELRYRNASGGKKMPAELRAIVEEKDNRIKELEKRIEDAKKLKATQGAKDALSNIQQAAARKAQPETVGDAIRRFAQRVEKGKIGRMKGTYRSSTGFDAAYDAALTVVAETLKVTADIVDAIEAGLKSIRSSEWYKSLQDKETFENDYRKHIAEEYGKAEEPYQEAGRDQNGDLVIDKDFLYEVVAAGVKDEFDFINKVLDHVLETVPDATKEEVMNAVSGYGKKINPSKDEVLRELNRLKTTVRLVRGLEDAQAGKGVKRSGYQREKPTDRQRELTRQINEELKNYPQDQAELDRLWATALDRIKTNYRNRIKDLTKRKEDIRAGIPVAKNMKEATRLDAEAELLKEQVEALKQELQALEGRPELSVEQKINNAIAAAERMEKEYQRRAGEIRRTGTYTKKAKTTLADPELDAARAARDAAKDEYDAALQMAGLDRYEATLKALTQAEDKLAALEEKKRKGDVGYAKRAASLVDVNNPELRAVKEAIKSVREQIEQIREETGLADQRRRELWINRKQKKIDELQRRIREKDYTTKVKEEQPLDMEMLRMQAKQDRLRLDLDVMIEKAKMDARPDWEKGIDTVLDVIGGLKSVKASMDLSAVLRQGGILSARHPVLASKAFVEMIQQGWSEKRAQEWMSLLRASDEYIVAKKAGLFLSEPNARILAMEEDFASTWPQKIPVLGRIFSGSNRAYSAYLNKLRFDAFMQFHKALTEGKNPMSGKELQDNLTSYAKFINNATGRGELPKVGRQNMEIMAPLLNSTFFAPRYVASRFNIIANALTGYHKAPPRVRMAAYKALGSWLGVVTTVSLLAKQAGAEVELDLRSSDFGKIRMGGITIDLGAGFQQALVFLARLTGKTKTLRTKEIKDANQLDVTGRFLRTKLSPWLGTTVNLIEGKNVVGEPYGIEDVPSDLVIPLIARDILEINEAMGPAATAAVTVPNVFGATAAMNDPWQRYNGLEENLKKSLQKHQAYPDNINDVSYKNAKGEDVELSAKELRDLRKLTDEAMVKAMNQAYRSGSLRGLSQRQYEKAVRAYHRKAKEQALTKMLGKGWKNRKDK